MFTNVICADIINNILIYCLEGGKIMANNNGNNGMGFWGVVGAIIVAVLLLCFV